jgi:hypothetical protein
VGKRGEPSPWELSGLADLLVASLGGVCSLVIFAWAAARAQLPGFNSEFINHSLLLDKLESQKAPLYSLWYLLQKLIVGSDGRDQVLVGAGLLLLGCMATLKGVILTGLLRSARLQRFTCLIGGILLGTAIALPVPWLQRISPIINTQTHYLGTIPANTFMSATQLVANIGTTLAFFGLQLWGRNPSASSFWMMILTALLASIAKPGISLALLVGIGGTLALSCWRARAIRADQCWQLLISIALLLSPAIMIHHFFLSGHGWLKIKAVLSPLTIWRAYSGQIPLDLLSSYAFPLLALLMILLYSWRMRATIAGNMSTLRGLLPCWLASLAALLIFVLLAEQDNTGYLYNGNFIWGAISANTGLHLVSLIAILELPGLPYRLPPIIALCAEACAGILYISEYAASGSFY